MTQDIITSLEKSRNIVINVSNIVRRLFRRQKETVDPEVIQKTVEMFRSGEHHE